MKKLLLLLLGLLLIFILTYVCFQSKAFGIKADLLSKAQTAYVDKNMPRVNVEIKGEGLNQTRVLSLLGKVSTEKQKEEAQAIAQNIEGIDAIDNQLIVNLETPQPLPPYRISATKKKVSSIEEKESVIENFKNNSDSSYNSTDNISMPMIEEKEVVEEVVNVCQVQFKEVLSENKIHFAYNKSSIKKESYELLNNLLSIAQKCPTETIIIGGHTDSKGQEKYNQKLSARRANAVKKYFVEKGINANRLEAIGYGELHPIATNATKIGQKQNRRIEIKIKGIE